MSLQLHEESMLATLAYRQLSYFSEALVFLMPAGGACHKMLAFGGFRGSFPIRIHRFTLWLFNIAMENGPFIDGLPIKHGDFPWLC